MDFCASVSLAFSPLRSESQFLLTPALHLLLSLRLSGYGPLCAGVHRKPVGMCGFCFQHVNAHMRRRVRALSALVAILGGWVYSSPFKNPASSVEPRVEHPRRKESCAERIMHLGVLHRRGDPGLPHSLAGKLVSLGMAGTPSPIRL